VTGRIMSMKNSSDTIGNQTRNLPACSTVPQLCHPMPPIIIIIIIQNFFSNTMNL